MAKHWAFAWSSPAARQIELMAAIFWDHIATSILHYCCENTIICHKDIASTFAYLLTSKSYMDIFMVQE
jgi:hypothetical protein